MESLWLVGLRRHLVDSGALDRYVDDNAVTGALWVPGLSPIDDWAAALVRLAEAGARVDSALVWDLLVGDVRSAAETLGHLYNQREGRDGFVGVWVEPERLGDPSRAAAHAVGLVEDAARGNVAVAFAWQPARAGAVSAIVGEQLAVAVSGATDTASIEAVSRARKKGMERLRKEDSSAEEVPVFLLGSSEGDDEWTVPVRLVTETGLLAPGRGPSVRLPTSPEQERTAFRETIEVTAQRSRAPEQTDEIVPAGFAASAQMIAGRLHEADAAHRIWSRDHTLWREDPEEVADRLGWLDLPDSMPRGLGEVESFASGARSGGVSRIVLLGMGGSSLGPETLHAVLPSGVALTVLDSTHPDHVAAVRDSLDIDRTLFVVASKSGTTVETMSHLEYFWSLAPRGERFVAITDAGTPLAALAAERGFRRCFENPPDVGGRFSALSWFGLVPAVLAAIDVRGVLAAGARMQAMCAACVPAASNPAMRLAAALADSASSGRDKLTFVLPPSLASFGDWVEQLVAESTGKDGKGLVPVHGEDLGAADAYGDDRVFCAYAVGDDPLPAALEAIEALHPVVRIRIPDPASVGAEMFRWEMAIAALGVLLEINPFDQPDVEAAKLRAWEALQGSMPDVDRGSAGDLLDGLAPPSYLAIQAFLPPTADVAARLQGLRMQLRDSCRVATTVGFGPRFLHSTGQLHKGGPEGGRFLQVVGPRTADIEVPGTGYTFGRLIDAQADGDLLALRDAGRTVARVTLDELERLAGARSASPPSA